MAEMPDWERRLREIIRRDAPNSGWYGGIVGYRDLCACLAALDAARQEIAVLQVESDNRGQSYRFTQQRLDAANALIGDLARALWQMRQGSCWCSVGIGNPMMGGRHSDACDLARMVFARPEVAAHLGSES